MDEQLTEPDQDSPGPAGAPESKGFLKGLVWGCGLGLIISVLVVAWIYYLLQQALSP